MMIKKILLLSTLGLALTGCVMAPYDDRPNYSGNHSYDRPTWNNGGAYRPDYRPNYRPNQQKPRPPVNNRPDFNGHKPSQHQSNNKPNNKPNYRPNYQGQKPTKNRPNWNSNQPKSHGLPNSQRPLRP